MDGLPFSPFEFMAVTVDGRGQITTRQTQIARQFIEQLPGGVVLEMVAIPAGTFLMGSPAGQGYADEHPQHSVAVRAFLVAKYPVTQEQ
jgi:formylglycine-generating enzyme required for sulfatase activity